MSPLLNALQASKRIHGFCPCCGAIFRLSNVPLFAKNAPPKTPFDRLDDQRERLERKIQDWDQAGAELRQQAVRKGQLAARNHVKRIAPFFVARKIEPKDVKVIFSPIKYVVFHGLADRLPTTIDMIDRPPLNRAHEKTHESIRRAIRAGNLEWRTLRVLDDGRVVQER